MSSPVCEAVLRSPNGECEVDAVISTAHPKSVVSKASGVAAGFSAAEEDVEADAEIRATVAIGEASPRELAVAVNDTPLFNYKP